MTDSHFPADFGFAFEKKIRTGAKKMKTFIYLKNLVTDRYVASVTPTSRFGVDKVCNKIDFSKSDVIVEYGPGTGVFTTVLLKNMPKDSKLIAIERNQNFCRYLKKHIKTAGCWYFRTRPRMSWIF